MPLLRLVHDVSKAIVEALLEMYIKVTRHEATDMARSLKRNGASHKMQQMVHTFPHPCPITYPLTTAQKGVLLYCGVGFGSSPISLSECLCWMTGGVQDAYILSNSDAFAIEQPAMLVASAEHFRWKTSSSSDFTESSISSTVIPDQAISWGCTECKAKFITIGLVEPVQW